MLTAAVRVSVIMAAFCAGVAVFAWFAYKHVGKLLP